MSPSHPITIEGDGVSLREFRPSDVADSLAITGDNKVTDWLSFDAKTSAEAEQMLIAAIDRAKAEPRVEYYLAITTLPSDQMIGFARLGLNGVKAAKLGYAVRADSWGKGYATKAAHALVNFGFTVLGLHRISAAIGPDNAPSQAVVKRLGFSLEGRIRDHVFTNGAWRDSLLYSILEQEWTQPRPDGLPDDWWSAAEVARYLGVEPSTVRAYVARQQMPQPDRHIGRIWLWRPETVQRWQQGRRRKS
jgi:[ribosomal protein S5]-alanine N-acetyltransferase